MVWGAVSSRGLEPLAVLRGIITGDHYQNILADHLHSLLQTLLPGEHPVFQNDNAPVPTSRCVQTWLHEHDDEVNKVGVLFPPPRALFELETALGANSVELCSRPVFGLKVLHWPAGSPDLSPIQHGWDVIELQGLLHPQP
ncbi:transposable element Tcb2 transposase [Trichonephila clavipes]|nr:transposable element Tcb2 transposase [Trichonephila clavipes]